MNNICKYLHRGTCKSEHTVGLLPLNVLEVCENCNFKETPPQIFCTHLGKKIKDKVGFLECNKPDIGETTLKTCNVCDYRINRPYNIAKDSPYNVKTGIVIGAYNWPGLIELQIKVLRATCGNIPILISDDFSDGAGHISRKNSKFYKMQSLAKKYDNVYFFPNAQRFGHSGGDLAAFWKGLYWAKSLNLDTVAKLSHRLVVEVPYWLQYYSWHMLDRDIAVSSQKCDHNGKFFPIRSEGVIMSVKYWYNPEILATLTPIVINEKHYVADVETIIWDIIKKYFRGNMLPLRIFRNYRFLKDPGVLWHHSSTIQEYIDLADKYNVELDEDFTNIPSQELKNYKGG